MKSIILFGLLFFAAATQQTRAQPTLVELTRRMEALERENHALKTRLDRIEHNRKAALTVVQDKTTATAGGPPPKQAGPTPERANVTDFDGFYAGVLGGRSFNSAGETPQLDLHGGLLGGFAGYNVQFSKQAIFGIEVRAFGDFSKETNESGTSFGQGLPIFLGSCTPAPCGPIIPGSDPLLSYSQQITNTVSRPFSVDLTTRIGFAFTDDWLLYTRLGAGAALFRATRQTDTSRTACSAPVVTTTTAGGTNRFDITGCGSTPTTTTSVMQSEQTFSPYLVAGAGLERNLGNYFGRIEADLLFHPVGFNSTLLTFGPQYYGRVTAGIGYRFH